MKRAPRVPDMDSAEVVGVNHRFREEVMAFQLRYRCADCIHVVAGEGTCSLTYPNESLIAPEDCAREPSGQLVFCKDFELRDE